MVGELLHHHALYPTTLLSTQFFTTNSLQPCQPCKTTPSQSHTPQHPPPPTQNTHTHTPVAPASPAHLPVLPAVLPGDGRTAVQQHNDQLGRRQSAGEHSRAYCLCMLWRHGGRGGDVARSRTQARGTAHSTAQHSIRPQGWQRGRVVSGQARMWTLDVRHIARRTQPHTALCVPRPLPPTHTHTHTQPQQQHLPVSRLAAPGHASLSAGSPSKQCSEPFLRQCRSAFHSITDSLASLCLCCWVTLLVCELVLLR